MPGLLQELVSADETLRGTVVHDALLRIAAMQEDTAQSSENFTTSVLRKRTLLTDSRVIGAYLWYRKVRKLHAELYEFLAMVRDASKQGIIRNQDIVDILFLFKKSVELTEDIRKEVNAVSDIMEKVACMLWVQQNANDPESAEPIRGKLATGTPDTSVIVSLPRKEREPEAYRALMEHLKVPMEHEASGVLKIHWPSFMEWVTTLQEQGKPLPPGIDPSKTMNKYTVRSTARRSVSIDDVATLITEKGDEPDNAENT